MKIKIKPYLVQGEDTNAMDINIFTKSSNHYEACIKTSIHKIRRTKFRTHQTLTQLTSSFWKSNKSVLRYIKAFVNGKNNKYLFLNTFF